MMCSSQKGTICIGTRVKRSSCKAALLPRMQQMPQARHWGRRTHAAVSKLQAPALSSSSSRASRLRWARSAESWLPGIMSAAAGCSCCPRRSWPAPGDCQPLCRLGSAHRLTPPAPRDTRLHRSPRSHPHPRPPGSRPLLGLPETALAACLARLQTPQSRPTTAHGPPAPADPRCCDGHLATPYLHLARLAALQGQGQTRHLLARHPAQHCRMGLGTHLSCQSLPS